MNPRRLPVPPAARTASPTQGSRQDAILGDARWCREEGDGLLLSLHVQPGAKRTGVAGLHGGALKLRLAARPVEGQANAALVRFLADAFGVPLAGVTIERGGNARDKLVRIARPARRPDRDWT